MGSLLGNARYCSINTHLGVEPTRRDDLESLAYVVIHFIRGSLPWQGLETGAKENHGRIMKLKESSGTLCRGLPIEFVTFLNYTRALRFDEKPDYHYIYSLFHDLYAKEGYQRDDIFEWTTLPADEANQVSPRPKPAVAESADSQRTRTVKANEPCISERRCE